MDAEKAFDRVDRDLLLYKLLNIYIKGHIYKTLCLFIKKQLVLFNVNNMLIGWFKMESGVKQGDKLSPIWFNISINGLANDVKSLNLGIDIGGFGISILLYADDIVLLGESEYLWRAV